MGAFRGAIEVGAHAIETDLHITKDGVIVLAHDATLKRCFGKDDKVVDCDWSYIKTLKTLEAPHEPMPSFKDLLEYLTAPGLEDIWVLLDIKLDNDPEQLMQLLASTLAEVQPSRAWNQRILLGCWAAKYFPLCDKYLPGYQIVFIGWSLPYARKLLKVPGVGFNMMQQVLLGPSGKSFMRKVQKAQRPLFVWTVNQAEWMKWSIKNEVDGVITDDPKKYLEICKEYDGGELHVSIGLWWAAVWINILTIVGGVLFRARFGSNADIEVIRKRLQANRSEASGIYREIGDAM
ncbi:glycerophosphoryl diester phosphodiesterase [Phlyctema vagabunda]|uniref:Glycerophosphoryl diester phosphodiesterase n=1 Tax=Phlyctema vagabunda TaxID=108571 RepID=A0ABR4PUS7_9HELO